MRRWRFQAALAAAVLAVGGCRTVGQVSNLDAASCADDFERALGSILLAQGEEAGDAAVLAHDARRELAGGRYGPRPFLVGAPSGIDYSLFIEPTTPACLLRLYGRQKGFTRYTNNLTWIETRAMPACRCTE